MLHTNVFPFLLVVLIVLVLLEEGLDMQDVFWNDSFWDNSDMVIVDLLAAVDVGCYLASFALESGSRSIESESSLSRVVGDEVSRYLIFNILISN